MSLAPAPPRHALGLPAGSVRALLALGVLGLSWGIVLTSGDKSLPLDFIYLQVLLLLIVATFFASHGHSIGGHVSRRSPLGLPSGSVRFLLLAGYGGLAYYIYATGREFETPPKAKFALVLALLLSGFFLGHLFSRGVHWVTGGSEPPWYQDLQAWVALLALLSLMIVAIVHLAINPSVQPSEKLDMPTFEAILAAIVGFYFGARS